MEVVGYDPGPSPCRLDSGGVDVEELLWVDGVVVLLQQVGPKLHGPVAPPKVYRECPAASPIWADVIVRRGGRTDGHAGGRLLVVR